MTLRANLSPALGPGGMTYLFEDFEVDMDRFELRQNGSAIPVEPQVFSLIAFLVANADRMVSKDEIAEHIWDGRIVSEAALSSRIKSARQALGDDGKAQRLIRTVHGKGFRFAGEVSGEAVAVPSAGLPDISPSENTDQSAGEWQAARPGIAVLPFSNMSGNPEQEYFADGITEDIISALSKHRWLAVVSRNTTFGYKSLNPDVRLVGEELGVAYVVEGSVRRSANRVRVTVQLVDATTGSHTWGERYDRDLEDIFEVQDEITETIVARLEPEIGAAERYKVAHRPHRNLQAWDCYHLGVSYFFKFTAEDNLEAQRLLQSSRELAPTFGEAHAWWAYAVILGMVYWDTEPTSAAMDEALAATSQALDLDDQNAVFYALKARVQLARREYDSALTENEMAISLNPTLAAAHCGLADTLTYQGQYEDAIKRFEKAIQLSPNDPQRWAFLTYGALALIFSGDFEAAVQWADRAREVPNCQYWTLAHKAVALAHLDRLADAKETVAELLAAKPGFSASFAKQKLFYLKRPEQLDRYLQGLALAGVPKT